MQRLTATLVILLLFAAATAAAEDALRLPANGTPNVPTNAHLWIVDGRTLDNAVLRDASGTVIPLERVPDSKPLRLRPTAELAPSLGHTLELRFVGVTSPELLTFTTGAGAEIHPPPPRPLDVHPLSWEGGGGGPWQCEKGTFHAADVITAESPGAVLYRLERSFDGTTFTATEYARTPNFRIGPGTTWYRIRPLSLSYLTPADTALEALQITVPAANIPPCYPPQEEEFDEGCSASTSSSAGGGLLALALGLLLPRRRTAARRALRAPSTPAVRDGGSV